MEQGDLVSLLTDDATSLLNPVYFRLRVDEEFKKSRRFGWQHSLLVIDVEGLEQIQEQEGQNAVRAALLDIAGIILTESRDVDLSARIEAVRFAMLLPGTPPDGAKDMVQRVMSLVLERFEGALALHIGLCEMPRDGLDSVDEWFGRAERGATMARSQGRNQLVHWTASAD